ncbi:VOC family protein [Prauserella sp. PE36]|uniref:VOC family protein n=1 Tax=Prauserella sp. PE36 TaxID=1504709 RepID=UPI000DE51660|nr:VOC family protein [Prauserella sp. PE36]RBM14865.1 VOC family protein [Prauserella sp. PE36]
MPVTSGINHVTTFTTDLDRMARFYSDMFGAEIVFERQATDGHPRTAIVELGGTRYVKFVEDPAYRAPHTTTAIERFGLAVGSLAILRELRERMAAAGAAIGEIERLPTQWVLPFTDPDGTPLQVSAHARPGDPAA